MARRSEGGGVAAAAATEAAAASTATEPATATATAPVAATTTTASATATREAHALELWRDSLFRFVEDLDEVAGLARILIREEGDRHALGTRAPCSADAMHIVLTIVGKVVVDNELDVLDICCDGASAT